MAGSDRLCPQCRLGHLVVKTNRKVGSIFWGCEHWPACDYAEPVSEYDRMVAMGHPVLDLKFEEEEST